MRQPKRLTTKDILGIQHNAYNTSIKNADAQTGLPQKTLDILNEKIEVPTYSGEYSPAPVIGSGESLSQGMGEDGLSEQWGQGLRPGLKPEDYYAENQTGFNQFMTGLGRIAVQTPTKLAQSGALLASGIGEIAFGWMGDGSIDLDDMVDNPLTNTLAKFDEYTKDQFKIHKPSNWNDQSFFQQVASTAWWADEGADGAAFALSALIPAGIIGNLGIGAKVVNGISKIGLLGEGSLLSKALTMSKAGLISPVKMAANIDFMAQNAIMTTSEAMFEAKDTGDSIVRDYLGKYNQANGTEFKELKELQAYDEDAYNELNDKKADAQQSTFFANLAALSGSNAVEIGLLNKIIGKSTGKLARELTIADDLVTNPVKRVARQGLDKFFSNTRTGFTLKTIGTQMATEGLYEENIQHAIQNVSKSMALEGKIDNLNYIGEVLKETVTNLGDKEAWKSIGAGAIIGGIFGGVGATASFGKTQANIDATISKLNDASNNWLKAGDIYKKDAEGALVVDENGNYVKDAEKMQVFLANSIQNKNISDIHDYYKTKGEDELADIAKNELVTNYVKAFMEAGLETEMKTRAKSWSKFTQDDLISAGFDPVELDQRGDAITKEQRLATVQDKINDLSNQYKVITRTIPETEGARVGETLSWYSRAQHLKALQKRLEDRKGQLEPDVATGNGLVEGINKIARRLKQITRELPQAEKYSLPKRVENLKKEQALLGEELLTIKNESREELAGLGISVGENLDEIAIDKTPQQTEYEGIEQTLVQVTNAINDATDKYNSLISPEGGAQFYKDLNDKLKQQAEEQADVEDLLGLEEGDYVEVKNKKGETASGFVSRNEKGNLAVGKEELNSAFKEKYSVTKFTEEQVAELKNNQVQEFQRKQAANRIDELQKVLKVKEITIVNANERLLEKLIEKEDLIANQEKGTIRLSEKQFAKQLRDIEKAIKVGEDFIAEYEAIVENLTNEITELRYLYDNVETIEEVQELIASTEATLMETEAQIAKLNPIVTRLKSLFGSMLNMWKSLFPKTAYNSLTDSINVLAEQLAAGEISQEAYDTEVQALTNAGASNNYTDYKQDFDLTKAELKQVVRELDELKEIQDTLYADLIALNEKLKQYQLAESKLNYQKPLRPEDGQKETKQNPVATGNNGERETSFNSKSKDINGGLFTTTGFHGNKDGLNPKESQRRWFKFAEELETSKKEYRLKTVNVNDPDFGLNSDNNIYAEDEAEFQIENNIKVLVVDKKGQPVYKDGKLIYTSLIEAKDKIEDYTFGNGTPMFTNLSKWSDTRIQKEIDSYKEFIGKLKLKSQFLDITRRSNGITRPGPIQSIKKIFGTDNVQLKVVTDANSVIGELGYPLQQGLVYAVVRERPVGLLLRKLNHTEMTSVLARLKEYAQVRGKKEGGGPAILAQITSTIPLIKRETAENEVDRSIYFLKGEDKLVFGDQIIDLKDLVAGTYDAQLLQFLSDINHHVNKSTLETKGEYRDVHGNKWASYQEYLTQDTDDAPLMANIKAYNESIDEPQFFSTYLQYSNGKVNKEKVEVKTEKKGKGKGFGANLNYDTIGEDTEFPSDRFSGVDTFSGLDEREPIGNFGSINEEGEITAFGETKENETVTPKKNGKLKLPGGGSIDLSELDGIKNNVLNDLKEIANESSSNSNKNGDTKSQSGTVNGTQKESGTTGTTSQSTASGENNSEPELKSNTPFNRINPFEGIGNTIDTLEDEFDLDLRAERVDTETYERINAEAEIEEVKKLLPKSIPFKIVKGLIDNKAFGRFTRNGEILISDAATTGTTYHEAFHAVFNLMLTSDEKDAIIAEWKNNNPSRSEDMSEIDIEEELAEEFREYIMTKESQYKSWFDKIVDFIKGLLGLDVLTKDRLFKAIADGSFKNADIVNRPLQNMNSVFRGMGVTVRKDVLDGLTVGLLQSLFKNGFDITDIRNFNQKVLGEEASNKFANLQTDNLKRLVGSLKVNAKGRNNESFILNKLVPFIEQNAETIIKEHVQYLKQFNVNLSTTDETLAFDENIPEGERSRDTFGNTDAIEFNTKSGMLPLVKMMLVSLPKAEWVTVNGETKIQLAKNHLGLLTTSDYRRNVAILHNALAGISDYNEQIAVVETLLDKIPEFKFMLQRLGGDATTKQGYYLQAAFRQQFDKARYNFYIQLYGEDNNYFIDANSGKLAEVIKASWQGRLRSNLDAIKSVNGQEVLNKAHFEKYAVLSHGNIREQVLTFYKELGITFSEPDKVNIELLASQMGGRTAKGNTTGILGHILKQETTSSNIFDTEGIAGYLNKVINEEVRTSFDYSDNQHISPTGKTVYSISLNDYISIVGNEMERKGLPEHLQWNEKKLTGNPLMRNSVWGRKINEGKTLNTNNIIEGARRDEVGELGKSTSQLTRAETAVQQFTAVMSGLFPYLRAGDKKLERGFTFNEEVGRYTIQEATDIFKGYLADEMLRSWMLNVEGVGSEIEEYKKNAKRLTIFDGLFDDKTLKPYLTASTLDRKAAIKAIDKFVSLPTTLKVLQDTFLSGRVEENIQELLNNRVIEEDGKNYTNIGLPTEILERYINDTKTLTRNELRFVVEQFTINSLIANIEQTKMFTGDIAFYKKFFKRTSGPVGTGKTAWVGAYVDKMLNTLFPRTDKLSDSKIRAWVFKDIKSSSALYDDYYKAFIADGFTQTEAKELASGYLNNNEADGQGLISLQEYREFLLRLDEWGEDLDVIYNKVMDKQKVSKSDLLKLVAKKPQYFGTQESNELFVPTFLKFSVYPPTASMPKGSNLERLTKQMEFRGIGLAIFESGVKTGATGLKNIYNESGEMELKNRNPSMILDYKYMKMQLQISPEVKDKVTFGSQFRKLILSGIFNKTLTINGVKRQGREIANEYNTLIRKQVQLATDRLIDELGIIKRGDRFIITKPQLLREKLIDQSTKRSSPLNLIEGLEKIIGDKQIKPLELSVGRNKLEQLLYSLVDSNMIKQKVHGDMLVLAASTGFEITARKQSAIKDKWATNLETLKFYTPTKGDTQAMEVYLPHRYKELYGRNVNIDMLDEELRQLVGFRIPTQGLNSIEAIYIKGFLPEEAGNIVVVPSELVTKAGIDFDVDKMNIFFPNYKVKRDWKKIDADFGKKYPEFSKHKGREKLRMFVETGQTDEDADTHFLTTEEKALYEEYKELSRDNNYVTGVQYLRYSDQTANNPKAVQNRIIELSRSILLAKENFTNLVTPNTIKDLDALRTELTGLNPEFAVDEDNVSKFVNWSYNLGIKETYQVGLEGVGPAALQNVHHILTQQAEVKMRDLEVHLPHHRDADGNVSLAEEYPVGKNKTSIQESISQVVNGFVDVANDTVLKVLNINIDTANTFFFLNRIGVPLRQTVLFLNQPIIREYHRTLNTTGSMFNADESSTFLSKRKKDVVDYLLKKYKGGQDIDTEDNAKEYQALVTADKLASYIKNGSENNIQRQLLLDYVRYEAYGQELSDLVTASTFDTNGTKGTLENARTAIENFMGIIQPRDEEGERTEGRFINGNKLLSGTFLGAFASAVNDSIGMYESLFLTERPQMRAVLNRIKKRYDWQSNTNKEKIMNLAKNDMIQYILQNSKIQGTKLGHYIPKYFLNKVSIPADLAYLREQKLGETNYLIRELIPILSKSSKKQAVTIKDINNIKMFTKRLSPEESNMITEAWRELLEHPSEQIRDFSKHLALFAILQSGLNNSEISYTSFIPNELYFEVTSAMIDNTIAEGIDMDAFEEMFINNNRNNPLIVRKAYSSEKAFTRDNKRMIKSRNQSDYIKKWSQKLNDWLLFKKDPSIELDNGKATFLQIGTLGAGKNFKEYLTRVSVLPANNIEVDNQVSKKETAKMPVSKRSELIKMINDSEFNDKTKKALIAKVNKATTPEEIGEVLSELCN